MKVRYLLLALLAALAVALSACGEDDGGTVSQPISKTGTPAANAGYFPVTITDDNGNEVTIEAKPTSIVALAPSFVEVLFSIGAGGAIVAADQNTDYPPDAADIPKISGFEPSVEGIVAYEPDLVLMLFDPGGLQEALQQLGIPTLFLASPETIEGTLTQISTLGKATGHLQEAEALDGRLRTYISSLKAKLPASGAGPRVYHEVDNTFYTAGPGSFINDLYTTLGAQNIAESTGEAFPQMSAEVIIGADPEVIILADEFAGETADTVAARPGWDQISAVKNGRVHIVDPNITSRPGPRLVNALETLARLLYPEAF